MVTAAKKKIGIKKLVAKKSTAAKIPRSTKIVKAAKVVKPRAAKVPAKGALKAINKPSKPVKVKKAKLVRDSFTMPETEYAVLGQTKKKCIAAGFEIKKSELLRIGVAMINALDINKIRAAQANLFPVKAGRPSKAK
jgi:hypothetical protein